ncbi:hypothetical protein [Oceanobacillus bengalensis]|uniref:Uncharacterized protein n=1 Tax=Oceanobacillus bengalensis TaxID=1435466 RepID=A0A494YWC5_9BACI|nr:hypothetical protein [Oceanobacillus bengalensis]RKQ14525.1 hypothetical protein D8M05_12895 [Oceanobacillus bengalensis]
MDPSFKGLYVKEWKMMRGFFLGMFLIPAFLFMFSVNHSIVGSLVSLLAFGFLILPFSLLYSLNTEAIQLGLWLHHPGSIHRLLLIKYLNGIIFASIYLLVISIVIIIFNLMAGLTSLHGFEVVLTYFLICIQMIIVSIFPAAVILFWWTLYQWWRTYIRGLAIIAIIGVIYGCTYLITAFFTTDIFERITQWGVLSIPSRFAGENAQLLDISFGLFTIDEAGMTIYLGNYIFFGVIVLLSYLLSAYLLDRKVEV